MLNRNHSLFVSLLILICSFWAHQVKAQSYQYNISILAIFQNEAPFLKEWIDYHRMIGVQHFLLYNHQSTDDYSEILSPYIREGIVELYQIDLPYPQAQFESYRQGISKIKKTTKWLAVIDIDEFLVPKKGKNLTQFLEAYEPYAGVVINWQLFGTSGIRNLPPGSWITKNLIYKFPVHYKSHWNSNHFVKSIIRPDRIDINCKNDQNVGNHVFKPYNPYTLVNTEKEMYLPRAYSNKVIIDKIQINHYWFKTLDFFYKVKLPRIMKDPNHVNFFQSNLEKILEEGNSEKDTEIQSLLQRLPPN